MDFFEVLQARHSTRVFEDQVIEEEKLRAILEAVNRAPSAGNRQAYKVLVVTDRALLNALWGETNARRALAHAPLALVFCTDAARNVDRYGDRGATLFCVQDATIACAYAQLAATALHLSSVWIGSFDENVVREVLGIDPAWRPVAILPIGYAGEVPEIKPRRDLSDLVHYVRR
jgi:nitroreductase